MTTPPTIRDKCFIIMPFGIKPTMDGGTFDFDKVYRVIIRRAVESAGMEAIRADEQSGSHIIHSDMFKELRDRTVVLADLSLNNPNVYYELGIRHVLSPGGTVLICREGTELPFDVRLSRVIFYRFNGVDLDWDIVEEVIPKLKLALDTAKLNKPDSPVHALLERVFPEPRANQNARSSPKISPEEGLVQYQRTIAALWEKSGQTVDTLFDEHSQNLFGARALGERCLIETGTAEQSARVARNLFNLGQHDLATRLYEQLADKENLSNCMHLTAEDIACYASAVSEFDTTSAGALRGIALLDQGLARFSGGDYTAQFVLRNCMGGLYSWQWMLTGRQENLIDAISHLRLCEEAAIEWVETGAPVLTGKIAKLHLRLLVVLRQRDKAVDRPDTERHRDAIFALDRAVSSSNTEASYLRWYQAICAADAGDEDATRELIFRSVREDAVRNSNPLPGATQSNQQYRLLRRFLENTLPYLNNHTLLGQISQALQYASQ